MLEEKSVANPVDGEYPYNDNYDSTFSYDAVGNPLTFRSGPTNTFNSDNQLFDSGFGYDGNGNPISYAGNAFAFDPENRATSLTTTAGGDLTATYDGDGMRATAGGAYFLYDGDDPIIEVGSNGLAQAVNIFGPDGWRGRYGGDMGNGQYYTFDPQGNVVQPLRGGSNGTVPIVAATQAFDGFGEYLGGHDYEDNPFVNGPVGFGGQWGYYTDLSTGYVFMTHRYYDPSTGRWINRDPIGTAGGINLYGFVGNNPITGIDPNGTDPPAYGDGTLDGYGASVDFQLPYTTPSDWWNMFTRLPIVRAVEGTVELASWVPLGPGPEVRGALFVVEEAPETTAAVVKEAPPLARAGEDLYVGPYRQAYRALSRAEKIGEYTAHHVVQDAVSSVSHGRGITITIRTTIHELTQTMRRARNLPTLRAHLAADIKELRDLLRTHGYDRSFVNSQLKELIRQNKTLGGFEK